MNKTAIAAAFRALSDKNLEVEFRPSNNEEARLVGDSLILPATEDEPKTRQLADEIAAELRFHDEELHQSLTHDLASDSQAFNSLEKIRCEILLAKKYPGAFQNLARFLTFGEDNISQTAKLLWLNSLGKKQASLFAKWVAENADKEFKSLLTSLDSQEEFAQAAINFINKLGEIERGSEAEQTSQSQEPTPQTSEQLQEAESEMEEEPQDSDPELSQTDVDEELQEASLSKGKKQESIEAKSQHNRGGDEGGLQYHVYTNKFDEVVGASDLADYAELTRLRAQLDYKMKNLKTITNRLASRLQQLLTAPQKIWWEFDQEDGQLDPARYSRLIANPQLDNIYKTHIESDFKDTIVSLLIDNSGSMRGRPIVAATAAADILARVLEQCGVKVEILGFTTAEWKGGKARALWNKNGSPENPGRLNDLRHIIYKPADMPWRRAKRNLGLALKEGVLKENIDGEAILWANNRLWQRPERRKILMVISDGAPVDDSTISANPSNYLDAHLRQVIDNVEQRDETELLAIGIGHDVGRYYKNAVTITDINDLGETMATKMEELFRSAA